MQKAIRIWALACVCSFSLHLAMAQQPAAPAQQTAAVVAEPESPRVVLQTETTASVLRLMKFSGLLRDHAGNPRAGAASLTFALYKDQQGGSPLWLETQNALLDDQGRYTVLLGSTKSEGLPLELFSTGEARWLGVQVNLPGEEEQPRVLLVSVPYALKAADAETLGGKPPSAFLLADPVGADPRVRPSAEKEEVKEGPRREGVVGPINGEGTTNMVAKFTGANTIGNSVIAEDALGRIGVNTTLPLAKLSVGPNSLWDDNLPVQISTLGPGTVAYYGANKQGGYGVLFGFENNGFLGTGGIVRMVSGDPLMFFVNNTLKAMEITPLGLVYIPGNVTVNGNLFQMPGADLTAKTGTFSASVPNGVLTVNQNAGAGTFNPSAVQGVGVTLGILGKATGAGSPPQYVGVRGDTQVGNPSATSIGVQGLAQTSSIGIGVEGFGGTGVRGGSPSGVGVEGYAQNATGIAGSFTSQNTSGTILRGIGGASQLFTVAGNGNVTITGNLTVSGTKSSLAKLEDGREVTLYAVESPENWFEDFGTARLAEGVAQVGLDPAFAQTVNTEMNYHVFLTPNGDCAGLYVAQKTATGLEVRELGGGKSSVAFDYRIVARRKGFEALRMPEANSKIEK